MQKNQLAVQITQISTAVMFLIKIDPVIRVTTLLLHPAPSD